MARPLPYPGFSWSITQHVGPAAQRNTIFELLNAAFEYQGEPNFRDRISQELVDKGLLSTNVRRGRPQPWRDYQQILTELGLLLSTRRLKGERRAIAITPIGLMLLDGLIGYSELITTQCIRYQYPNGYKQDLSTTVKEELAQNGIEFSGTRTELDAIYGVSIKPAVLILRILIELEKSNERVSLSTRECAICLMPTRTNRLWPEALEDLRGLRLLNTTENPDSRVLRHIQEWFRLLGLSDLFEINGNEELILSRIAMLEIDELEEFCQLQEMPEMFWTPTTQNTEDLTLSWFDYYGNPSMLSQWYFPEPERSQEYIAENYIGSNQDNQTLDASEISRAWTETIQTREFLLNSTPRPTSPVSLGEEGVRRFEEGIEQRSRSTRLHDEIVNELAMKFQIHGYQVAEDPESVDLLVSSDKNEAILEVKTVTARNLRRHLRLGLAQVLEYRYRRKLHSSLEPATILVLSNLANFPQWLIDFFDIENKVSLVARTAPNSFNRITLESSEFLKLLCSPPELN